MAAIVISYLNQEEEEQFGPLLVATLEQHGIAATDVKKLMVGSHTWYWGRETFSDHAVKGCGILHCRVCGLCSQEEVDGD